MKKRVLLFLFILLTFNAYSQLLPVTPWKELGPIKFPINASGQINGIGRTCQIKHHATDTSIIYAVTSSGGLYKTTDGANNWFNLTGSLYLPKGSQASVCIDYANDNIIYLGTGDPNYYYNGTGVWKSTDGGLSFVQKNTGMGNRLVDEILQSPTNRGVLIAATNSGIYKSNDSANTWTLKTPSGLRFTDMEYKPGSNGRVIYAVTLDSGYYRSLDFGETWTNLMNTGGLSIPSGGSSNGMRVAVCPADTNIVYIGMVKNFGTIFKSNNGGTTFAAMKNASMPNLTGYNNTAGDAGQGNYNFDINCDPINPSILYLVSHNVWKSIDSGVNWVQKTNWWAVVHTDMHHISFSPHNKSKHFNANDGGIWLTTDGTNSWAQKSDGLAANEISPAASSNLDYKCISTGTQDNGELYRDDTGVWKTNRGGDWYEKMNYDWKNPRTVYYITGKRRLVNGSEVSLNFPFTGNANYIDFNPKAQNSAVISKNDSLWISKNIQDPIPSWSFIGVFPGNTIKSVAWSIKDTNRLYLINSNSKVYRTDNLYAATPIFNSFNTPSITNTSASIAVIAKNDSIVYISCGNIIYRSNNAGNTWTNIKYNYPAVNVIRLYHDPYTSNESIYSVGSIAVYFKMDTMTSWQNLTQSLPTNASIQSVIPYNEGTDKSEMRVAYFGKGVWSIPIQTQKIPNAKFGANYTKSCSLGKTISFTDSSSNNPTSWSWSFPGGTPSSSTLQNPNIVYNTPGVYNVTLTAANANGSYTETKTALISVFKGDTLPISENFESGILPVNWTVFNDGNDNRFWVREDTLSAYGVGSKSYRFDNRAYMNTSKKDAIITSILNLNMYDSVWVSFDRAFAPSYWSQWYSDSRDTLQLAVDNSCNTGSLTSVWMKGHTTLATGPVQADGAYFKPTTSQWKKDTINLTAFAGQKEISLYFRIFKTLSGGYGQVIYLDNINIWGKKVVVKDTAFSASICSGNNYTFGSNMLNTAGTYKDTIRKVNTGADSIRRTLVLTVNPKTNGTINQTICQGQPFLFNGINRTVSGAYLDTLVNTKGCDSILTLNLTVNSNSSNSINQTICQGQSFLFNDINRMASGSYLDTLVNAKGCDSIISLNLTVTSQITSTFNINICQGQSYIFNGVAQTTSGIYLDTFMSSFGCDSIVTLNLTVNPKTNGSVNQTICQGQSYMFNGIARTITGTYLDTLVNSKGCDSILTLNLNVLSIQPQITGDTNLCDSVTLSIAQNYSSYLWSNGATTKNIVIKSAGTYSCTISDVNGCSGITSINVLNRKIVNIPQIQSAKSSICSVNDSVELTATSGFNGYSWSTNQQGTNKVYIKNAVSYTVTVYNNYGCSASASKVINSAPSNTLTIGLKSSYCIKDSLVPFTTSNSIPCISSQKTFNNVTASNLNFKNYVAGKYMASYTCIDTNNCSTVITKEISLLNCPLSGLVGNDFSNKIIVYPNPARNSFVIEFLEMGQYQIAVYSILGQLIQNQSVDNEKQLKMDVSRWAKGVYYIRIYSKDLNLMDTKKLEIE
jgi:PKD repeat protein